MSASPFAASQKPEPLDFASIAKMSSPERVRRLMDAAWRAQLDDMRLLLADSRLNPREARVAPSLSVFPETIGFTALHMVVGGLGEPKDRLACARMLLPRSDLLDQQNSRGLSPLMLAAQRGRWEDVELLLPGSVPRAVDAFGRTALMHASLALGDAGAKTARALLSESDLGARDPQGNDPLTLAASAGNEAVCRVLLPYFDPFRPMRGDFAPKECAAVLGAGFGIPSLTRLFAPLLELASSRFLAMALKEAIRARSAGSAAALASCAGRLPTPFGFASPDQPLQHLLVDEAFAFSLALLDWETTDALADFASPDLARAIVAQNPGRMARFERAMEAKDVAEAAEDGREAAGQPWKASMGGRRL